MLPSARPGVARRDGRRASAVVCLGQPRQAAGERVRCYNECGVRRDDMKANPTPVRAALVGR